MPPVTYPNQRVIKIHREKVERDFLGIKNSTWQAAARDLRAHGLMLYLYLASNADNFELAFSPAHVSEAIGMPRSTCSDQFKKLIDKGYLVPTAGNRFEFFETPQTRGSVASEETPPVQPFDWSSSLEWCSPAVVKSKPPEDIEINNINSSVNSWINNSGYQPTQNNIGFRF